MRSVQQTVILISVRWDSIKNESIILLMFGKLLFSSVFLQILIVPSVLYKKFFLMNLYFRVTSTDLKTCKICIFLILQTSHLTFNILSNIRIIVLKLVVDLVTAMCWCNIKQIYNIFHDRFLFNQIFFKIQLLLGLVLIYLTPVLIAAVSGKLTLILINFPLAVTLMWPHP